MHPTEQQHGVRVLVVDDDPDVAGALALTLADGGCEVRVAHDGLAALDLAQSFDAHCVLLDLCMPPPDGLATARLLRDRMGQDLVLVGITGWNPEDVALRNDLHVMDHCLRKPVDLAALRRILPMDG